MTKIRRQFFPSPHQAVLIINPNSYSFNFLSWSLCGQPFIIYLLENLTFQCPFLHDLIVITPENSLDLRQLIRNYALEKPLKIRVFSSQETIITPYLFDQIKPFLQTSFFLFALDNQNASFQIKELRNWQADLVVATDQNENLLQTYFIQQKFLDFIANSDPGVTWSSLLAQFAQSHRLKSVVFEDQTSLSASSYLQASDFWLSICQKSLASLTPVYLQPPDFSLASTVRGFQKTFFGSQSQVGEYTVFSGPNYIGKNCRIGNFCHLHQVIIEDNVTLPNYLELSHCYIGHNHHFTQSFCSEQNKVFSPLEKEALIHSKNAQ